MKIRLLGLISGLYLLMIPGLSLAVVNVYLKAPNGSTIKAQVDRDRIFNAAGTKPLPDGIYLRPDGTRLQIQSGTILQSVPAAGPVMPTNAPSPGIPSQRLPGSAGTPLTTPSSVTPIRPLPARPITPSSPTNFIPTTPQPGTPIQPIR
jgi:hypothetical protein